jgi:rhamnogalacturonyl hydrolase YesR
MKRYSLFRIKQKFIYSGVIALFNLSCFIFQAKAQSESIEAVVQRVADNIIGNTSYQFLDNKTKEVYTSVDNFPSGADIKAQSRYNKWEYANGVLLIGMLQAAREFGKKEYAEYACENFDCVFRNAGYFKEKYALDPKTEWAGFFRMGALDDCGAMAAALADVNEQVKNKQYGEYLDKVANYILNKQYRLSDGTLCRIFPRKMTIWADDLYMSVPFLARMGRLIEQTLIIILTSGCFY